MSTASLSLLGQCMLGFVAMGCLCLSMERHARQVVPYFNNSLRRTVLRWTGWALFAMSLFIAVATTGWGQGLVSALGALSLSALCVIALLSYRPKWLAHVIFSAVVGGAWILGSML